MSKTLKNKQQNSKNVKCVENIFNAMNEHINLIVSNSVELKKECNNIKSLCKKIFNDYKESNNEKNTTRKKILSVSISKPKKEQVVRKSPEPNSFNVIFTDIIEEINCNASLEIPSQTKYIIATKICKLWKKQNYSIEEAKKLMYDKYNIQISYHTKKQTNVTNIDNMYKDIEYNEINGCYVYGWDLNGNSIYEPTLGLSMIAPQYQHAGMEWREVLDLRFSQLEPCERQDIELYTGN